ncbi:Mixed lineage kinase domain-like protein [Chelonia mydas]|uniref:Mixed lineage kinase domain-like protein n=1 Tax=Chelonia mydas TaxID=8469 RepID=M7AQ88_CHEMY|nr:Mixed lineage kinase domain-like protein [Chelonia mydas]
MKKLQNAYRKAREANPCSGAAPTTCHFYKELDAILGGGPTSTLSTTIDTSEHSPTRQEEEEQSGSEGAEEEGAVLKPGGRKVREIFRKEIETMKKFESPNILRMYGICIDESGSSPCFSIVMEYCEKGTLRDVLTRKPQLPWETRIRMALDAARGLYRLHQTGEKSKLHGCINSTKFLVAKGYCVKLSGFELSKTESSIKRSCKKKLTDVPASAYISPLGLASLSHNFGIVLWEIATGKIPFEGCTSQEIYQKVYEQRYQAPVGEDCPSHLQDVINQCRAFEPLQRPSAEEIVDSLIAIYGKINTAS